MSILHEAYKLINESKNTGEEATWGDVDDGDILVALEDIDFVDLSTAISDDTVDYYEKDLGMPLHKDKFSTESYFYIPKDTRLVAHPKSSGWNNQWPTVQIGNCEPIEFMYDSSYLSDNGLAFADKLDDNTLPKNAEFYVDDNEIILKGKDWSVAYVNDDDSIDIKSGMDFTDEDESTILNWAKNNLNKNVRITESLRSKKPKNKRINISESLKKLDRKEFDEKCSCHELESLYESVKTRITPQQKQEIINKIRNNNTVEDIYDSISGMLTREKNEELDEGVFSKKSTKTSAKKEINPNDYRIYIKGNYATIAKKNGTKWAVVKDFKDKYEAQNYLYGLGIDNVKAVRVIKEGFNDKLTQFYGMCEDGKTKHVAMSLKKAQEYATSHPEENISYIEDNKGAKYTLTEELKFDYVNDADKAANEICKEADKAGVWDVDIVNYSQDGSLFKITFEVRGDWSHDHVRFNNVVEKYLEDNGYTVFGIREYVPDDDEAESDNYESQHTVIFSKGSELEEGLTLTEEENTVVRQQAVNGSLEEWDPQVLMNKVMESGLSMNTHRFYKDKSYIINIFYKDLMGERGINNPDTKYWVDIVEIDEENNQNRIPPSSVDPLLSDEVVAVLNDWKDSVIYGE